MPEPPPDPAIDPAGAPGGMDCDRLVELVTEFVEGALDARTEHLVVGHLVVGHRASCEGCGTYLEPMRQTARSLGALPRTG